MFFMNLGENNINWANEIALPAADNEISCVCHGNSPIYLQIKK
jgi:hypothetical protein